MASTLGDIAALDAETVERLRALGIRSLRALVEAGRTRESRAQLARSLDAAPEQVLAWAQSAELFTVRGIGARYGRLLEAVGVASVARLRSEDGRSLSERMAERNTVLQLCRNTPDPLTVTLWIEQAKQIELRIDP